MDKVLLVNSALAFFEFITIVTSCDGAGENRPVVKQLADHSATDVIGEGIEEIDQGVCEILPMNFKIAFKHQNFPEMFVFISSDPARFVKNCERIGI